MLRWSDTAELRSYLDETLKSDDWAENGRYFKWLAQNAFLLPMYLADLQPPTFRGIRLDSWPAIYLAPDARPDLGAADNKLACADAGGGHSIKLIGQNHAACAELVFIVVRYD